MGEKRQGADENGCNFIPESLSLCFWIQISAAQLAWLIFYPQECAAIMDSPAQQPWQIQFLLVRNWALGAHPKLDNFVCCTLFLISERKFYCVPAKGSLDLVSMENHGPRAALGWDPTLVFWMGRQARDGCCMRGRALTIKQNSLSIFWLKVQHLICNEPKN